MTLFFAPARRFNEWFPSAIKARKIVCFITAAYLKSPYCMKEFGIALAKGSHVSHTSHSSSRKNPERGQLEISHWTCHPWPLSEPPGLRRSSSPPPIAQRRFAPSGAPVSSVPPLICGAAVATLFR